MLQNPIVQGQLPPEASEITVVPIKGVTFENTGEGGVYAMIVTGKDQPEQVVKNQAVNIHGFSGLSIHRAHHRLSESSEHSLAIAAIFRDHIRRDSDLDHRDRIRLFSGIRYFQLLRLRVVGFLKRRKLCKNIRNSFQFPLSR